MTIRGARIAVAAIAVLVLLTSAVPAFAAAPDDDPPGVPLPASPVTDTLDLLDDDAPADPADWYSIVLQEGDRLKVAMTLNETDANVILFREGATLPADGLRGINQYTTSMTYLVPVGGGGTYLLRVTANRRQGNAGPYAFEWSLDRERFTVDRLSGLDRYETALNASRSVWSTGAVDAAVLVTGERHPDALCASGLAGALGRVPVLLSRRDVLPTGTREELQRLGVSKVYLIGGTAAVSEGVERELDDIPGVSVERIAGADRYETSAMVASTVDRLMGDRAFNMFVVNGDSYADAASCSYAAARLAYPVMLVRRDSVPAKVAAVIPGIRTAATIVGGTSVVSTAVQKRIDELLLHEPEFHPESRRLGGADRYETSALVARYGDASPPASALGLATGECFADSLVAGPVMARLNGTLLLVGTDGLDHPATGEAFDAIPMPGVDVILFGGTSALADSVAQSASQRLEARFASH